MDEQTLALIKRLKDSLEDKQSNIRRWDNYYQGEQHLQAMGLALPPEMHRLQVVINWPRKYVDTLDSRLEVEGFRLVDSENDHDKQLMDIWRYNNMEVEASIATVEALALSHCYITVGVNERDSRYPLISIESPYNMAVEVDQRTREVLAAARFYDHDGRNTPHRLTLYLPDETLNARLREGSGEWVLTSTNQHGKGYVPVTPLVNRSRLHIREGVSEMQDIIGLTDAACRTLTNLQGAQELMAVPQRYILGADQSMFQDADGGTIPTWQAYLANILAIPEEGASVGQFQAAELRNFTETVNSYARHVSAMTGIPAHDLGLSTENPASAEAIKSAENRLVKQVERKQSGFGTAWAQVMAQAADMAGIGDAYTPRTIEPIWRDASTPTYHQKTESVKALALSGLIDTETALEELGYSPGKIEKIQNRLESSGMSRIANMLQQQGG